MTKHTHRITTRRFEQALRRLGQPRYDLRLYVDDMTPRSIFAIENVQAICKEHLSGRYRLQVVDIGEDPRRTRDDQVFAVPALVKRRPGPIKTLIGDLSDADRVLVGLGLQR